MCGASVCKKIKSEDGQASVIVKETRTLNNKRESAMRQPKKAL